MTDSSQNISSIEINAILPQENNKDESGNNNLNGKQVAGIVVGVIISFFVIVLCLFSYMLIRLVVNIRKMNHQTKMYAIQPMNLKLK